MKQFNSVHIYGTNDWNQTQEFINVMINKSNFKSSKDIKNNLIKIKNEKQNISIWKLNTKYYEAILEIQHFFNLTPEKNLSILNNTSAIVIFWDNNNKDHLSSVLQSFSDSNSESDSRLVIVQLEIDILEDDHEWYTICFEHGFECHSIFNLDEASMSWQCCNWPYIQIKKFNNDNNNIIINSISEFNQNSNLSKVKNNNSFENINQLENINENEKCIKKLKDLKFTSIEEIESIQSNSKKGKEEEEQQKEEGFDDDFSPFVSAETNLTNWNYEKLSDDDDNNNNNDNEEVDDDDNSSIKSIQIKAMTHKLFGHNINNNSSNQVLDNFESLISKIDQLRIEANCLKPRSRQRFAAQVALAFESQLCSD